MSCDNVSNVQNVNNESDIEDEYLISDQNNEKSIDHENIEINNYGIENFFGFSDHEESMEED